MTNNGATLLFTSHTTPEEGRASATCSADGSNVVAITNAPGGQDLQVATQISDDAATIFGYKTDAEFNNSAVFWTASGGFQPLALPAGFTTAIPVTRCISTDGKVSAGDMSSGDFQQQAYRWTAAGGVSGLGYLPGGDYSRTLAMSSDGMKVIGTSAVDSSGSFTTAHLFMWTPSAGMISLGRPPYKADEYSEIFHSAGVSADGSVAAVGFSDGFKSDISYIVNTSGKFYVEFTEAVAKAGGTSAMTGWSDFVIKGMTDDGNTVFGRASNPEGKTEGFIAQFPPGFLQGLEAPGGGSSPTPTPSASPSPSVSPSPSASPSPSPSPGVTSHLANIATRLRVGTGDDVLIAGFILRGSGIKKVAVRGIGPSLSLPGRLIDPVLELYDSKGDRLAINDQWQTDENAAELAASTLAPIHPNEAALLRRLPAADTAVYTAILSGSGNTGGIGVVEVYDLDQNGPVQVVNIATRGLVQRGDDVMIGGVIVTGQSAAELLVRAIGPSLALANRLQDPVLELFNEDGERIAINDDWRDDQESAISGSGLAPQNEREAAIRVALNAGNYTAVLSGSAGGTGVGIIEIYKLSP